MEVTPSEAEDQQIGQSQSHGDDVSGLKGPSTRYRAADEDVGRKRQEVPSESKKIADSKQVLPPSGK